MTLRKQWERMDTFDRIVCLGLCAFTAIACAALAVFVAHGWSRIGMVCVGIALMRMVWFQIPTESLRSKILTSICGDDSGPEKCFCVLEPDHPGDHKRFHSSGGMIGWPQKGGN